MKYNLTYGTTKPPKRSLVYWSIWLVSTLALFFQEEIPAIGGAPGDTLSEYIWWVPGFSVLWGTVTLWLSVHFFGKGKWDKSIVKFLKGLFT